MWQKFLNLCAEKNRVGHKTKNFAFWRTSLDRKLSLGSSDVFRFFVFLFSMQIRFFPWRWSELQIKIFSYLFCRIFSISYSILHCKMLFENGFKRRIRWRNNGVGATVDSEMKMHWNEEVLRILALHFWGLSDLVSYSVSMQT